MEVKEKTKQCDSCEEVWEESFFCEKCSSEVIEAEEEFSNHDLFEPWEFEYDLPDIPEYTTLDICGNCCHCHYNKGLG